MMLIGCTDQKKSLVASGECRPNFKATREILLIFFLLLIETRENRRRKSVVSHFRIRLASDNWFIGKCRYAKKKAHNETKWPTIPSQINASNFFAFLLVFFFFGGRFVSLTCFSTYFDAFAMVSVAWESEIIILQFN